MEMTLIRTPGRGGAPRRQNKLGRVAVEKVLETKRSVVCILNDDEMCCARAIVTMKAFADADSARDPDYVNLRKGHPAQKVRAEELHTKAKVPKGTCGIKELQMVQQALPDYQIKVLSVDKPHMIIFAGPEADKKILLLKVDEHYHGCNLFAGFLERSYFCHDCNKGYSNGDYLHHPCKKIWCPSCKSNQCEDFKAAKERLPPGKYPTPTERCTACNRDFFGNKCHSDHHHSGDPAKRSICQTIKKCLSCHCHYDAVPYKKSERITAKYRHRCGYAECPFCLQQVDQATHKCFIQPIDPEEDEPKFKKVRAEAVGGRPVALVEEDGGCWVEENKPIFVYADYEAMTSDSGLQTPILVCCESEEEDETNVFYSLDCTEQFFDYLDDLTVDDHGDDRKVIVIFHNFKGYDGMFVLKYLYDHHRYVEDQITIGTKVLSLCNELITFKDSLCFLPFPLSSFPATFGLTEQCKGFFPHLFNTQDNQSYQGVIPDTTYYDPDGMSHKKKAEFLRWHAAKVSDNYVFNLKKEMKEYCISDVKLLKAGCEKFQAEFASHAEFRPMERCITIASACNRFWRKKLLPKDTIAVEPPRGWFGATTNSSRVAQEWLAYENHMLRLQHDQDNPTWADRIKTSTNGGEVRVFTPAQSFLVDGFDQETNTVYEFHGCLWHGCVNCFPKRNRYSKLNGDRSFREMYEATLAKEKILRHEGYQVKTIWECRWRALKNEQDNIREFVTNYKPPPTLNPRHAFFGGRTNAVCLYHCIDPTINEQVKYVDVTSLYPWVNAEGEYPVGHPEVITNPTNQDIRHYFGMALVDIVPPYELYHPVLPLRQSGKLTFPLCAKCVEEEMQKPMLERSSICLHSKDERMLRGTWCTPELLKAQEKGNEIVKIHEVWHFKDKVKGLFKDYVNQWLKVKQESAGYPSWADTQDKKTQYGANYKEHQGIELDADKIVKNPGRKATAKLMLNSFRGKFGENLNKPQVISITEPASLFQLLYTSTTGVERIRICTPELLEVVHREPEENQLDNGKRNIFVAAFTTCYARLKLYHYLDLLKEQVLYFDTDSSTNGSQVSLTFLSVIT